MSRIFCFLLMLCLSNNLILTQTTAVDRAETLKGNVVSISALGEDGFGFITGEWQGELFIVTAAHVVEAARDAGEAVDIKFFNDYREYKGKIIQLLSNDIALLSIKKPNNLNWQVSCLGFAKKGDVAAFIGRNTDWYIPVGNSVQGAINRFQGNSIIVDILSVQRGTSGAPLITASGIVGMIVATDGVQVTVRTNSTLRNALSEYPYFFQLEFPNGEIRDRDGNLYPTSVMKDGKRWMTKNLNVKIEGASWCYNNKQSNCDQYGRLYTWNAAEEGCAALGSGWSLPTDDEWKALAESSGGYIDIGDFPYNQDNQDKGDPKKGYRSLIEGGPSGFSALLGGQSNSAGSFRYLGAYGNYWSATVSLRSRAIYYYRFDGDIHGLYRRNSFSEVRFGISVRCVK